MKVQHHPFYSSMLGENALSRLEIMLAKTHRIVKTDLRENP